MHKSHANVPFLVPKTILIKFSTLNLKSAGANSSYTDFQLHLKIKIFKNKAYQNTLVINDVIMMS